jgi:TolA-binding protein
MGVRFRFIWKVVLLTSILAAPVYGRQDFSSTVETFSPAVVTVSSYDSEGNRLARTTGFFLNEAGEVLTAYHALRDAASVEVVTAAGKALPVRSIVAEDVEHDLILLATPGKPIGSQAVPSVSSFPSLGETAAVIGSPRRNRKAVQHGTITQVKELPSFGRFFRIDTRHSAEPGSLVVNMEGAVVGVTISHGESLRGGTVAVPYQVAARLADKGVLIETTRARDFYFRGMERIWEGRFMNARSFFRKAVDADSSFAEAWFMLGYCNSRAGKHHIAAEAYRQALRLRPDVAEAHFTLGNAYGKIRCFQDAAESYEKAVALKPDDVNIWFKLAMAYDRLGWNADATATFKRAVCRQYDDLSPGDESCREIAFDRLEEFMHAYTEREWTDDLVAEEHFQKGLTYLMLARMELSLQEYEVLRKMDRKEAARLHKLISP